MKPEESAGCHQTLSSRVGSGFNHVNCRSCIFPLCTSNMSFVYKTLLLVIDSLVDVHAGQPHHVQAKICQDGWITSTVSILNNWLLIVAYTCININAAIRTCEPCLPADTSTTPILTFNIVPWVGNFLQ